MLDKLKRQLHRRIMVLDGAMGTMIQRYGLSESQYRGDMFTEHAIDLQGNNDILSLTQPEIIRDIHKQYLDAGSDFIETNTFNANGFSQADYDLTDFVYEMNLASAKIAKEKFTTFYHRGCRTDQSDSVNLPRY